VAGRVSIDWIEDSSGNVTGRRRTFGYTSFGQISTITAERSDALTTSPGSFAQRGSTSMEFWFNAEGQRFRQIKDQVQIDGDLTNPEALRTTITTIGAYEEEYVQDVARSTVNTFEEAEYIRKEVRHYFP